MEGSGYGQILGREGKMPRRKRTNENLDNLMGNKTKNGRVCTQTRKLRITDPQIGQKYNEIIRQKMKDEGLDGRIRLLRSSIQVKRNRQAEEELDKINASLSVTRLEAEKELRKPKYNGVPRPPIRPNHKIKTASPQHQSVADKSVGGNKE